MKQILIVISPLLLILLVVLCFTFGIKGCAIFLGVIVAIHVFIYVFDWWVDFVCKHFN